ALGQGFGSIEHPAFQQNFQCDGTPHKRQQAAHFAWRHGKAQPIDGYPETGIRGGNAQITLTGDFQTPAYANALNLGQNRMNTRSDGVQCRGKDLSVIMHHTGLVGAMLGKLAYIGTRREVAALASYYHTA